MKKLFIVPAVAGLLTLGGVTVAEASTPTTVAPTQTAASSDDDGGGTRVCLASSGCSAWPDWPD